MSKLVIEDLTTYRFLSGVQLSPEGGKASFLVHQSNEERDGYQSDLYLYTDARGARQLTASGDVKLPVWLDDETLLFASGRGKKPEAAKEEKKQPRTAFYTLSLAGGEAQKAFEVPLQVERIEPLEGGKYVLCASCHTAPGDEETEDCIVADELPFHFNGKGIVNKQRSRLYLFDGTGEPRLLTPERYHVSGWSLDEAGRRLVFFGSEYADIRRWSNDLRVCDLATGAVRTLLADGEMSIEAAGFLGEDVVFLGSACRSYGINENPVFYRTDPSGGYRLLCGEDLSTGSSVGSDCRYGGGTSFKIADGTVYFLETDRCCSRLSRLTPEGKRQFVSAAKGSVDGFDIRGERCVFVGMRGMKLQELYTLDLATGEERPLTSLNGAALAGKALSAPRYLPFQNEAGMELDGWVIPPVGYDPAKRYPAILDIHGGPKTVYGDVFFHEMQVWANAGYFVFFCNPRGGDGRGNGFADIRGRYGEEDYRDIMAFCDVVLEKYPAIDAARLGVTGGSYGGFMTNWIIGHTGRFAAAASQRSIANWTTMEGASDIGFAFPGDQVAATSWDNPEKMWKHSPLRYADRCKTPTLFIHSREDYRCPEVEGVQMFSALKRFGVEARLCLFKGENHELSRSGMPRRRIRRLEEIGKWFDAHLKCE